MVSRYGPTPSLWQPTIIPQSATLRVQVHCPSYAKAGYGYTNPWWSTTTKQSWGAFNRGPSAIFSFSYKSCVAWLVKPQLLRLCGGGQEVQRLPRCLRAVGGPPAACPAPLRSLLTPAA